MNWVSWTKKSDQKKPHIDIFIFHVYYNLSLTYLSTFKCKYDYAVYKVWRENVWYFVLFDSTKPQFRVFRFKREWRNYWLRHPLYPKSRGSFFASYMATKGIHTSQIYILCIISRIKFHNCVYLTAPIRLTQDSITWSLSFTWTPKWPIGFSSSKKLNWRYLGRYS